MSTELDTRPRHPGHFPIEHGARSPRIVDPVARELAIGALLDRPELAAYPEAVASWAYAETQLVLYQEWHARVGFLDEDGSIRGGFHYLAAVRNALRLRARLGLDPMAEAQLRKMQAETAHTVVDLEAIRARGREALARRNGAPIEVSGPDV